MSSESTILLPPRAQLCIRYCSIKQQNNNLNPNYRARTLCVMRVRCLPICSSFTLPPRFAN